MSLPGEPYSIENRTEPAIILTGDVICEMSDERRQEVADSLAQLLGVEAVVQDLHPAEVVKPPEDASTKLLSRTSEIPPFTLLWEGVDENISGLAGLSGKELVTTKRALHVLWKDLRNGDSSTYLFSGNYESEEEYGRKPLRGVTFNDPQAIIDHPSELQKVNGLGSGSPVTLGRLARLITTVA
jgi:hypothetical protein